MLCSCRAGIIQLLCLLDPSLLAIVLRVAKLELLLKELTISDQDLPATLLMAARQTPLLLCWLNQDQHATPPMAARLIPLLLCWLNQDLHATLLMDARQTPLLPY